MKKSHGLALSAGANVFAGMFFIFSGHVTTFKLLTAIFFGLAVLFGLMAVICAIEENNS